ncbi:MAG: DUF7948 domain-containing protein, partial [Planctomycetota bacterium]
MDAKAAYYLPGRNKTLYFTPTGIVFALQGEDRSKAGRWIVKLDFLGMDRSTNLEGKDLRRTRFSYFKGKPEDHKTGVPAFGKLIYEQLWPGIDLVYSGAAGRIKYEFHLKPEADPNRIQLAYEGASEVFIDESGKLHVVTPTGSFFDDAPCAFQEIDGERIEVPVRYALRTADGSGKDKVYHLSFDIGSFDRSLPLIIDPSMLVYCGYVGGEDVEKCYGIAVDNAGCAYVTGYTQTDALTFPVKTGPDLSYNGSNDAFVAKISADGTRFDYCGYIGGDEDDAGFGIAVDDAGCAYVTGNTRSDPSTFPVKTGPVLSFGGVRDAFVAKVNPQGTELVYCGYIGGSEDDGGYGVALDNAGNAYYSGWTYSDEVTFPVSGGPDTTHNGDMDAYVAKVNSLGTGFFYCGYIGGSEGDTCFGIDLDDSGRAHVIGNTFSDETTFPVLQGPDLSYAGDADAFVARLDAQGSQLEYCGYVGGDRKENGLDICVDSQGDAFVIGWTHSDENSFPVKVGPDLTFNGGSDIFVARIDSSGSGFVFSGYVGGAQEDYGLG